MPTYPLAFPAFSVSSESLRLQRKQTPAISPFTLQQTTVNGAAQWQLQWTWPQMRQASALVIQAWLNSLEGQVGTFSYAPKLGFTSSLTHQTLNVSGYALNTSVQVKGWNPRSNSFLNVGQYFQIGSQLLQITSAPTVSDENGYCTIQFEPPLRSTFYADTAVQFVAPQGLFRISSNDALGFTLTPADTAEFGTITAIEAVE